jgi:high-affinity iron transporter
MFSQRKLLSIILFGSVFLLVSIGTASGEGSKPPKKTPQLVGTGKKLFEQNCMPCHGVKGDGKGPAAAALKPPPADFAEPLNKWPITKGNPVKIFEVISKGIPNSAMVKWDQLSEKERWGLVYFVMEFSTKPSRSPKK